jgi:hypothetical protein
MKQEIRKSDPQPFQLTPKQSKAWRALFSNSITDVMYGGAKGGGKSYLLCVWAFELAWLIAEAFDLPESKNPPHVGWIGRKQATDFAGSTLQTWREIIPDDKYELKGGTERDPKHILINHRIAIDYGGLDKQENINKFNSAEYSFIGVDQAEEITRDEVSVLRASRRMKIRGRELPYRGLFTANPRICWLKDEFINHPKRNMIFIPALPSDNPHLPRSYKQMIYDAFGHRPELIQAYWYGSWTGLEGANQTIKEAWIEAARLRESVTPIVKRYLVCDPARFGDDEAVIMYMCNTEIEDKEIMPYCSIPELSHKLKVMRNRYDDCPIVVEATGGDIGAGVVDHLEAEGIPVIVFNPSGRVEPQPDGKISFYNRRAEAWWKASRMLARGLTDNISNTALSTKNMYDTLKEQLIQPTYDYRGGKLIIESKKDIKERLGRSPDHADTYVIALDSWDQIPSIEDEETDRYRPDREKEKDRDRRPKSAMAF